jgi:hypothetical protein
MGISKLNVVAFLRLLKILLVAHAIILIKWEYYRFDSTSLFKYPLIDALNFDSAIIHYTIFGVFLLTILLFCLRRKKVISLSLISLSFFYFIFSDLFLFHHDIFLSANITLLTALYIKYNKEAGDVLVLAFKGLLTIVMFFSFFYKLNNDFHSGLLIKNLISNNSLLEHFVDFKGSEFIDKISPIIARTTIIIEGLIPLLLWTRYKYIGAAIGCLLHFGICFSSGAGIMFNLYVPLLYLFFIPLKEVELAPNKFNRFLKLLDFYGGVTIVEDQKIKTRKEKIISSFRFLSTNVFFLLLLFLYVINVLRALYNVLFN